MATTLRQFQNLVGGEWVDAASGDTFDSTSPADGATRVASTVASAGPTTNTSSSSAASSEYAVCRRRTSCTACVQRARTIDP